MKDTMRNAMAISIALVLLSACSSNPMKVALTELGTSSDVEYGAYNYRYMRTINITGLSPEESIGTLTTDPDRKKVTRFFTYLHDYIFPKDFPDMMNARIGSGETLVHVSSACKIETDCLTALEAVTLKDNIQKREILIGKLANAEIDIKTLQLTKIAIDGKSKAEEKEALLTAIKQKFIESSTIKDATLSTYAAALSSAESSLRADIVVIQKELDSTMKAINKPGVIVSNWKLENSATASGTAPGINGGVSSNKDKHGYVIFINPTQYTLEVGSDIGTIIKDWKNQTHMSNIYEQNRLYMTTYQMRVSELIYSESLESIIAANIDIKIDELTKTLQPLLGAGISFETLSGLKAQVAAEYKRYSFSSNQGMLSFRKDNSSTIDTKSFSFFKIVKNPKDESVKEYFKLLSQSRSVINQRVSFNQYVDTFVTDTKTNSSLDNGPNTSEPKSPESKTSNTNVKKEGSIIRPIVK